MAYSKNIRLYLVIILVAGWAITLTLRQAFLEKKLYRQTRILMGTFFEVISPDERAGEIVFKEVARLEQLLSKYKEDSEISKLNRSGRITASADTFYIIQRAKENTLKTNGAFDITVAPLMDLWGFSERNFSVPSALKIKENLRLVGADKIILHERNNVIEFKLSGMKIDLGGIAKGYALDRAVEKLKANHIKSCLINAGGQVYALGKRSGRKWKVSIRSPRNGKNANIIELTDQSAATSGGYEQFFLKDGQSYCHIIDPKTGYPVKSGIVSVTIIEDSGLNSDALSTAIFVLGENGINMLKSKFSKAKFYIIKD
jgi:thiamine biosynthesis lipoprotein